MPSKIYDDQNQDTDPNRLYDEHGLAKNKPADAEQAGYDQQFKEMTSPGNYGRTGSSGGRQQPGPSSSTSGAPPNSSSQRTTQPSKTQAGTTAAGAASLGNKEKAAVAGGEAKAADGSDLADAEQQAGLYNPDGGKEKKKFKFTKKKGIITLVMGGSTVTIIAGLLSLSSLMLPSLSYNTDNNRLARFTRNLMVNTDMIIKLKLALDATGDEQYSKALQHFGGDFGDDGTPASQFWTKINRLRPEKVAERLILDMQFNYTDKSFVTANGKTLTRRVVSSITVGAPPGEVRTIEIPQHNTSFTDKVLHPITYFNSMYGRGDPAKGIPPGYKRQLRGLVDNLLVQTTPDATTLTERFKNLAVRGKAATSLRKSLNIKEWRWLKSEVEKANKEGVADPTTEEIQRSYAQSSGDGQRTLQAAGGDSDATAGAEKTNECFKNPDCTKEAINNGDTIAPQARADLDARFDPNKITAIAAGVVGSLSTVVDISNLACKMYDSSVLSSRDIINANSGMAMASYASFSAAADQIIFTGLHPDESRVNSEQVGGYSEQINGKVGDTEAGGAGRSNTMRIARGEDPNTSESPSPQASAIGMFATNPFNFLPGQADDAMLALLGDPDALHAFPLLGTALALMDVSYCDAATNIWTQISLVILELGVSLVPGVGQALKGAGLAVSKFAVWAVTKQVAQTIGKQFTLRNLAENGAYYAADNIISMIAMASAVQRMGGLFNGASLGEVYLNQVDAGAESQGQELSRIYGAGALDATEYAASEGVDDAFRVAVMKNQSVGQRYFALNNPSSLTNRLAVTSSSALLSLDTQSIVGNLSKTAANILNPTYFFSLFGLAGNKAFADGEEPSSEVLDRDYGITQFDWTEDELEAMRTNPEYSALINEKEFDDSGKREEIVAKYGRCFAAETQPGDMLAGNPEGGQIFTLLKGETSGLQEKLPLIFKDNNANTIPDQGLCSPDNTGDFGPPNDGVVTFKSDEARLVFRHRISIWYNQGLDQLLEVQDPGPDVPTGGDSTGLVTADGYSFPLDPKIKYSDIPCHTSTCHWDKSYAYDLYYGVKGAMDGAPVYAISDGVIDNVKPYPKTNPVPGCYSIQFHSDDTYYYWYGHLQNPKVETGQRVTAGTQIAEVANLNIGGSEPQSKRCRGGRDHLHIDRGCVEGGKPQRGGNDSCRDRSFIPFLTDLWLKQHY